MCTARMMLLPRDVIVSISSIIIRSIIVVVVEDLLIAVVALRLSDVRYISSNL